MDGGGRGPIADLGATSMDAAMTYGLNETLRSGLLCLSGEFGCFRLDFSTDGALFDSTSGARRAVGRMGGSRMVPAPEDRLAAIPAPREPFICVADALAVLGGVRRSLSQK